MKKCRSLLVTALSLGSLIFGCVGNTSQSATNSNDNSGGSTAARDASSDSRRKFPLDGLETAAISVNGKTITVWLAQDEAHRTEGLMFVQPEELGDTQGMLFVFPDERLLGFWMRNTVTPLDIAFARMDGTIVRIWQMPPLTLNTFPSGEPAMFALEMKAGSFEKLGIREGDRLDIPQDILKPTP
ncbi:MAG: DUF192 domain-containing protein [Phycisphaerales bacterium]|nr:DUF192 domain-containing protein [Phycisphaerales bacterium]